MRIKLILENDVGIKKRKFWYLVDEGSCTKVADISYLIKKRFFSCDGKISLSLDGFFIPPQEDVNIIQENDMITVKFSPESTEKVGNGNYHEKKRNIEHAPTSSSLESDISSSESEEDNQLVNKAVVNNYKKNTSKELPLHNRNKVKIPVKKTIVKKSKSITKPSDALKKVASNIHRKSPIKSINLLMKAASNVSTETNKTKTIVPNNVISKPVIKKTIPLSKLSVSNVTEEDSSSDSSDSSSSLTDEETQPANKKMVTPDNKKKMVPTDNKKKMVPTDNKKKMAPPESKKTNVVTNSNVKSSSLINKSNEDKKNVETINDSVKSKSTKQSSSSSSDSSDSSSDSSNISHGDKKEKVDVDFQVSKLLKDKNLSGIGSVRCTDNNIHNNKPGYVGNSKEKKMLSKDVYKNKSEFIISKPFTMDNTANNLIGGSLNTKNTAGENSVKDLIGVFSSNNDCVSGKTLRNRRRNQIRKENMKNRQLLSAAKEQDDFEVNGSTLLATNGKKTNFKESTQRICDVTMNNEENESISIEDNTATVLESKPPSKNYDSFAKLTEPPDVGSMIGYKILEMSTISYTPEVSDYKEACMKSYDKETNILELEVSEGSQSKNRGDSQVIGKFEMPDINGEGDLHVVAENTMLVRWNELIEPCLLI